MNKKFVFIIAVGVLLIGGLTFTGIKLARAETAGSSPESGADSYTKTIYTSISGLNQGSDAAGSWGDWGAYWNRIKSTTSYLPASMVNQVYNDSYGAPATETTNYSLTWTTHPTPVTGDDNRSGRGGLDPRTGLTWSQYLKNNAGTVEFAASSGSTWSWDGTTDADNIAVGSKTAKLLCSDRGSSWRLPTQVELMQAYVDGSFWNLTNPSINFWSSSEYSATYAWYMPFSNGGTGYGGKSTTSFYVRCVRP